MMLMKRAATVGVALLLTVSSSLAFGVAVRHIAWDGMVQGRGASKIRGLIEMVGGKVTGTTAVEVQYTGDAPGAARAWHVHVGSCAKGGAILGGANAYQSLTVDAKGAAKGVLWAVATDAPNPGKDEAVVTAANILDAVTAIVAPDTPE